MNEHEMSGDCAKLREALKHIKDRLPHMLQYMRVHWEDASAGGYFDELMLVIDAALAEPVKNCEVGTVKEQYARFRKFCKKDSMDSPEATAYCAYECPCGNSYDCKLAWAQLPYVEKEGGAK